MYTVYNFKGLNRHEIKEMLHNDGCAVFDKATSIVINCTGRDIDDIEIDFPTLEDTNIAVIDVISIAKYDNDIIILYHDPLNNKIETKVLNYSDKVFAEDVFFEIEKIFNEWYENTDINF